MGFENMPDDMQAQRDAFEAEVMQKAIDNQIALDKLNNDERAEKARESQASAALAAELSAKAQAEFDESHGVDKAA